MPDTGFFGHVNDRQGARISLRGDDGENRVWAGPHSRDHQAGFVGVYHASAESARVSLETLTGTDVAHPARGLLRIRGKNEAVLRDTGLTVTEQHIIEENLWQRVSAGNAQLKVDEEGGFLFLRKGDDTLRIDNTGVQVSGGKDRLGLDWEFVAVHPENPDLEIHYCVVEGPEVGVFARGTARLRRGAARVALPDHFAHVASAERLTVHLTPRSAASKGVAATLLSPSEIVIRELGRGRGAYDVDWIVHGLRKGREEYRVVRPRKVDPSEHPRRFAAGNGAETCEESPEEPLP